MSASQEKRRRQSNGSELDKKLEEQLLENKKKSRKKIRNIIIGVVIAIFMVFVILLNTDLPYNHGTAVQVGDVNFTVTDFNYYYYTAHLTAYSSYGSLVPTDITTLKEQACILDSTKTWSQYLETQAIESMSQVGSLYTQAVKEGWTLSEDSKTKINEAIDDYKALAAAEADKYKDLDSYLVARYGKGANENVIRKNLEIQYLAQEFSQDKYDSYEYSQDVISSHYTEIAAEKNIVKYRMFYINDSDPVKDDYDTDEAYNAAVEASMAEAKAKAEQYLASIKNEAGFIAAAKDADPETYSEADSTLYNYSSANMTEVYRQWLTGGNRTSGDCDVFEGDSGYYIVMYLDTNENDYETVNFRQIVIQPDAVSEDDYNTTEEYEAAKETAKTAAYDKAKEIYDGWLAGSATEDDFAALADENSAFSAEGGLIKNMNKDYFETSLDSWLFDSSRQAGDTDLIFTDAYGYHIVYYVGTDMLYCDYLADQDLRNTDYTAWTEDLYNNTPASTAFLYFLTK